MMSDDQVEAEFPYSLVISTPFPTTRLAQYALQALQVDQELSPSVRRSFSLVSAESPTNSLTQSSVPEPTAQNTESHDGHKRGNTHAAVLQTCYSAKTNRMLRVAVNGFMESLCLVIGVMQHLDVDVLTSSTRDSPT